MYQVSSIKSDPSKTFSENLVKLEKSDNTEDKKILNTDSTLADIQNTSNDSNKKTNAVKFKKIFKDCYFYINDVSDTYKEYFEMCKGRCTTSVVVYRNRLIEIILKRGGGIEASLSPYVTHFIVEKPTKGCTWWIFRRIKGIPKQYHFVTAKFVVESHLKGKRMLEKQYFPKFLDIPSLFTQLPSSNENTPIRKINQTDTKNSNISGVSPLCEDSISPNEINNPNDHTESNESAEFHKFTELHGPSTFSLSPSFPKPLSRFLDHYQPQIQSGSHKLTPKSSKISKLTSKVESYRFTETWSQVIDSEGLLDFQSMECGIYMNGYIVYLYFEDFLLDALVNEYWDGPSAIYHFNRIVSQNSYSRKLGVKNGMSVDSALVLCSGLKLAKYDYEKVIQRGLETLRILKKYTHHILSPNYNEYYLQISYELCRKLLEEENNDKEEKNETHLHNMKMENNKGDIDNQEKEDKIRKENEEHDNDNIFKLVSRIYNDVDGKCVIGIGKNMLIAKLASKKCRHLNINSQESDYDYELSPLLSITGIDSIWSFFSEDICIVNDGFKFLNNVYLSEIPGVNLLGPVLKSRGLVTCNDVRKTGTPLSLQGILGGRLGKLVYNFCFGYDYRCANLPKKQLDFFLNKSFKSFLTPENFDESNNTLENSSRDIDEDRDIFNKENEINKRKEIIIHRKENEITGDEDYKEVKEKKKETKEERALRKLLSMILKQVCSVYSLFDKCIINYSIVYKCTVVLLVHIDFSYSKTQTSILDKQSLRHTINNLYRRIKKELGIEFSEIKRIQLELKDIVRVDQNVKFIDKFLKEKMPSPSRSLDPSMDISSFYDGVYVTSKDSTDTPKESMFTPTRRLNGWRIDSLSSTVDPSQYLITPPNHKRSLSSGSGQRRNNFRSKTNSRSGGSREQTPSRSNGIDSSVDSYLRTPSRTKRTTNQPKNQKSITEYLSPIRYKSN